MQHQKHKFFVRVREHEIRKILTPRTPPSRTPKSVCVPLPQPLRASVGPPVRHFYRVLPVRGFLENPPRSGSQNEVLPDGSTRFRRVGGPAGTQPPPVPPGRPPRSVPERVAKSYMQVCSQLRNYKKFIAPTFLITHKKFFIR
jgi:hypothetical protein